MVFAKGRILQKVATHQMLVLCGVAWFVSMCVRGHTDKQGNGMRERCNRSQYLRKSVLLPSIVT